MTAPATLPVELDGRTFCGDLDIRIDGHGVWHYNGSPIRRQDMVCLFASMLVYDGEGGYWLVTPTEMGRIDVDDAPFIAQALFAAHHGENQILSFYTNVEQVITVAPDTPLVMKPSPATGQLTPYVVNERGIEAKVSRATYYELVELGTWMKIGGEDVFGVWSKGAFFPLGTISELDA